MSITVQTGWLKDHNGEKIAPKTLSSQIITSEGKSLEEHIKEQLSSAGSTDGIVVNVEIGNWIEQSDGTYTNTIIVDGISSSDVYDVNLYEDYSEEQAMAFDFLVTSIDTKNNKVILTASQKINTAFSIILRGKVNLEYKNVFVSDLSATSIEYDNSKSRLDATNMQNAMDEIATMVNGLIVNVTADGWNLQEDGTYRKIILLEQLTGNETLDVCLYPGDVHTEAQNVAFSELVNSIETAEGMIILTSIEEITVAFRIFLYGKVNFEEKNLVAVKGSLLEIEKISEEEFANLSEEEKAAGNYLVDDGEDDEFLSARNIEFDGFEIGMDVDNVHDAIVEVNSSLESCFQSVSEGKELLASVLTDKGVTTASDATFEIIAGNINNISNTNEIWTNPSPTSAFNAQTITFDGVYDKYIICMAYSIHVDVSNVRANIVYVGTSTINSNSSSNYIAKRNVTATKNSITFSNESQSWGNEYGIPTLIIGLNEATVKLGDIIYYYLGDEKTSISGGWTDALIKPSTSGSAVVSCNLTKNNNSLSASVNPGSGAAFGMFFAVNPVDLTDYTRLEIESSGCSNTWLYLTTSKTNYFTPTKEILLTSGTNIINISSLTGSYYIGFGLGGSHSASCTINKVQFFK